MNKVSVVVGIVAVLAVVVLVGSDARAETIWSEGFEGAFPGSNWLVGDANVSGTPAYWDDVNSTFGGEPPHSGGWKGYCAGVGYAGSAAAPIYRDYMSAYMSRTIDLTTYSSANLSFWYKIPSMESGFDNFTVYVDGAIVWTRSSFLPIWTQVNVPLNAYVGGAHTLKFVFNSDYSITYEGAYLDDIVVTGTPATATIADAWWAMPSDVDGDGYVSSAYLKWNSNVTGGLATLIVNEKIYYKRASASTWTLCATAGNHPISGSSIGDLLSLLVNDGVLSGMTHDKYDWKIEIYRAGKASPDYTRRDTNDADLNDWKGESSAEEVAYLPNDLPLNWYYCPWNFGFDVRNYHWAAIGINPAPNDKNLSAGPNYDMSEPYRTSYYGGTTHDFVVLNGSVLHSVPYYARVKDGVSAYYWIEAENDPPDLTIGTRLSGRSVTDDEVLDLYQVKLAAGHKYTVNVSQSSGSTANLSVFLFKPTRTGGKRSDRDFYRNSAGIGGSETLTFTAAYSGRWGILVSNDNGGAANYSIKVTRVY